MELSAKKEENVHYVVHLHVHTNVHVQLTNVQTMDLYWCLQLRNEHIHVNSQLYHRADNDQIGMHSILY